jgi:hypothetical protein
VKDLKSGVFVTGGKNDLPRGMPGNWDDKEDGDRGGLNDPISRLAMAAKMGELGGLEPQSLAEAKRCPDWARWKEAMEEEREALEKHNIW